MRVSWSLETWSRVSEAARDGSTLCCGSDLVLLVCACVYVGVLGFLCVFAGIFALLVLGRALIFLNCFSQALTIDQFLTKAIIKDNSRPNSARKPAASHLIAVQNSLSL